MSNGYYTFDQKVKNFELRKRLNVTQKEMADILEVSHTTINRHEQTVKKATGERIKKVRDWKTGEEHEMAVLTDIEVNKLRELYATGKYSQTEVGERFNVGRHYAHNIIRNKGRFKKGDKK